MWYILLNWQLRLHLEHYINNKILHYFHSPVQNRPSNAHTLCSSILLPRIKRVCHLSENIKEISLNCHALLSMPQIYDKWYLTRIGCLFCSLQNQHILTINNPAMPKQMTKKPPTKMYISNIACPDLLMNKPHLNKYEVLMKCFKCSFISLHFCIV